MKIISLHQPWSSFIAWGRKSIETRSWGTDYRGPIAIHSALRWKDDQSEFCLENNYAFDVLQARGLVENRRVRLGDAVVPVAADKALSTLPKGGIVAVANMVDCFQVISRGTVPPRRDEKGGIVHYPGATRLLYRSDELPEVKCLDITAQESAFGDHSIGRWCWLLDDIRPVEPMIPLRGYQGLWNAEAGLLEELGKRNLWTPATGKGAGNENE